jgi:hypothetical protein
MIIFADMKQEFHQQIVYSTVFNQINSPTYYGCVVHLICLRGCGSFVYNDKTFTLNCNDIAVISRPDFTPKYLSDTIRRATGQSALSHINQSLVIVIKDYLAIICENGKFYRNLYNMSLAYFL